RMSETMQSADGFWAAATPASRSAAAATAATNQIRMAIPLKCPSVLKRAGRPVIWTSPHRRPNSSVMARIVTAAVMLIGDEILSARTQDTNLKSIADFLTPLGVEIREARVVPDVKAVIVDTVKHLAKTYDYVFATGGIGPTHDDITADCV